MYMRIRCVKITVLAHRILCVEASCFRHSLNEWGMIFVRMLNKAYLLTKCNHRLGV